MKKKKCLPGIGGLSNPDTEIPSKQTPHISVPSLSVAFCVAYHAFYASTGPPERCHRPSFFSVSLTDCVFLMLIHSSLSVLLCFVVASEGAKRDIVFLMDGSEENKSAFPALREFVTKMVENLLVAGDEDRVAVVQFSDVAEPAFYLNTYLRKEEILNFVQGLRPRGGSPRNTGAALHFVKDNVFVPSAGSRLREAVPQILILLTSGRSEDDIRASANALKQMGVVPLTVGDSNADTLELQMVAFEPSHAFSLPDFDDLPRIQQQLLTFVRGVVGQGRPEVPTVLVDREGAKRDIVFLLDASDDTADGFPSLREFLVKIVEHLDMDGNRDRVAVIQYSNEPVTSFYLNTFLTKPDVLDALRALRHLGGPLRNAGRALDFVKKNIFVPSAGSRHLDGVPQVLIYVSGGRSRDDVRAAVTALKQQGVVPFSVGTSEADTLELQTVSYDPSFALSVPGFDRLDSVEQQLLSRLKRVDRLRTPEPPVLVEREGAERDVVFLVDGSDETRNGFPAVQEFLIRLVEKLDVQPNKDRVSVVQYSNDADVQFYLSTYFTKEDVLNAIRQLRHKGGKALNMGAALHFVKDNVFIPSAGSRLHAGVPQVLTVLSAGRSTDDIRGPVSSLKKLGVVLFGIGIQKADTLELQIISHDPSFAMSVPEFSDLVGIQQQFLSTMTNIPGEKKNDLQGHLEDGNTDVVFLLDGSDDNKNGFKAMCEFIIKVVENFDVQTKRDQVAVVQYSDEVAVHFFLNTFSTNGEVISAIRSMQPRGGGPLSTGKALQFVKDKVLVSSAGSRRAAGIPQFLILLTSGKSRDDVRREALALKRLGILSFGVGAQNADTLELQTISHDPSFALSVSDVDDLSLVLQPLSFFMRLSMQKRPETPTFAVEFQGFQKDVVFVLDGSDDTRNGFPAMRDFIQGVVETLDVQEDKDRVAVVQYSNDPEANLFFNSHSTKEDVLNAVRGLRHKGGRPLNTGAALQFVRDAILSSAAGSRHGSGVPQILILLSAGTSGDDITGPGSALREMGVVSFAVGIRNADDRELQALSYGPDFAFTTSEFSELPNVQQQIVSSLRGIAEESTEAPLVSLAAPMDVVFLLDGSDDIKNTFPVMRDFVQRIVEMLEVQEDKDRVAVVQYSNEQDASLFLNTYFTKEDVLSAVRAIRHKGGRPLNTGAALQFVRDAILSSAAGGRHGSGVPQILVLLSAGTSGDDVRAPSSALKRSGVVIFAIGTKNTDSEELQMLSHNATFALSLTNFSDLPNVQEQLVRSMKAISRRRASQSPLIPVGVDGTQRDVVFLLDGSSDTRNAFPAMRDFVRRIVETLDVQENQDRVAVVQYSNDQDARLFLNTHFSKEDVLNAIRGLRHKGGRPLNTGAALRFVKDSVFSSSAGSRPADVPKILIVLSGGPSADDVQRPSAALKQKGVLSFSIGARSADDPELQALSYHPDYALRVPDLSDLPSIQQALVSTLRTLSKKRQLRPPTVTVESEGAKKDVVFVIDGSDDAASKFSFIKEFLRRVVESLSVAPNKIRVGIVQYSDVPFSEMLLNSHTTKEGVLNSIKQIQHRGGSERNIGAALQHVRSEVLTPQAGSRIREGVPQFLIVLVGGTSTDDVRGPAVTLKQSKVVPFGIGTGNAKTSELQTISYNPNFSFKVNDFSNLFDIQQQFINSLTELSVEDIEKSGPVYPTEEPDRGVFGEKRDIVFLVDGSNNVRNEFGAIRDMISKVVKRVDVGLNKVRVSLVQYSDQPKVEFLLNEFSTRDEVLNALNRMRGRGGNVVNTGRALEYVGRNVFQRAGGSRIEEGVPQVLVVVTGSPSSDDVSGPAEQLKLSNVAPLAVGAKNADTKELRTISLLPDQSFVVREIRDLQNLDDQVVDAVTTVKITDRPAPTQIIIPDLGKKDIIFLIDGSTNVGPQGIVHIRDFMLQVLQQLDISPDQIRVGVVQYSNTQKTEFSLGTHTNKNAVINAVRRLRQLGGSPANLAQGIEYVLRNELRDSAGARPSVASQHLVVLTGGSSSTDVSNYGNILRGSNVNCIGIGSREADFNQLGAIATSPDDVLRVNNLQALINIPERVLVRLSKGSIPTEAPDIDVPVPEIKPKIADIVFLVDGTINFGRDNFKEVMQFIIGLIDSIYDEKDSIQISLAQYATDVKDEFLLNTHKTKDDIIEAIEKTNYRGGNKLNTGAAIKHIQDKHFIKPSGSRRDQGVPQIAFVVTGGKSLDDGQKAAMGLKAEGYRVYAVGVGNVEDEINKLGSESTTVFRAVNVQELSELNEQILETLVDDMKGIKLCTGTKDIVKECNLEVLVGFDVTNVSPGSSIFVEQKGLESKVEAALQRISQMRPTSCSGTQVPTVRVGILALNAAGQKSVFDLAAYKPELVEKFRGLRTKGPYILASRTINAYRDQFKSSGTAGSVKVVIHFTDGADEQLADIRKSLEAMRSEDVSAFVLVGLERATGFDDLVSLEFGRGFRYSKPLRINQLDLDYELLEELDNIAERACCGVPCKCSGQRGDRGLPGPVGTKGGPGGPGYRGHPGDEGSPVSPAHGGSPLPVAHRMVIEVCAEIS
ncbi:CO6A3 protein, partial [Polypterus senegalus]